MLSSIIPYHRKVVNVCRKLNDRKVYKLQMKCIIVLLNWQEKEVIERHGKGSNGDTIKSMIEIWI